MADPAAELSDQKSAAAPAKDVRAALNYVGEMHERAVYDIRNPAASNIVWDEREVTIHDVRPHSASFTMDKAAFAFVKHRSNVAEDPVLFDGGSLASRNAGKAGAGDEYAEEICDYIRQMTGAREVFPRLNGLVMRTSKRAQTKDWQPPADFVHLDFAPRSARGFLDKTLAATGRDLKPYSRLQLFQAWRCVTPGPQDSTLAICDGSTVPQSDGVLVDSRIGPPEIPGNQWDSRMAHYRESHRWYYMPDMTPEDLILFKGYDSDAPDAMNAMHSAFDNPLGQTGTPRRSIEARIFAVYD